MNGLGKSTTLPIHYPPCPVQTASPECWAGAGAASKFTPKPRQGSNAPQGRAGQAAWEVTPAIKHSPARLQQLSKELLKPIFLLRSSSFASSQLSSHLGQEVSPQCHCSAAPVCVGALAGHHLEIPAQSFNQSTQIHRQVPNFESQRHSFLHYLNIFSPDKQKSGF